MDSGVHFVASGDDIYYAEETTIKHLDFTKEQDFPDDKGGTIKVTMPGAEWFADVTEFGNEDSNMLYNGLAIHPKTGNLYTNTIKGFGLDFRTNQIWVIDTKTGKPVAEYKNLTHSPAGTFFPISK